MAASMGWEYKMANNLLDTIRTNSALTQQGQTDETAKLGTLLRARSGKSLSAPTISSSNLGEQSAVAQTNSTLQNQVAPTAALQNAQQQQQSSAITQQAGQQMSDIAQSRRFDDAQSKLKTDQLLSDLERNKGQIDVNRDKASLEQAAFQLRLQNQNYVQDLQREGARARLDNDVGFKQAIADQSLNINNQELLQKQLGNKSILSASDREFKQAMAQMGVDTAYDMFTNEAKAQKERAIYSSIASLAGASMGAGANYADNSSKQDYYTTGAGKGSQSYEASKYRGEV